MNKLIALFSRERNSWCVFVEETELSARFLWECQTEDAAKVLSKKVNEGAVICKGSRSLGTACGKCIKCELTE